MDEIIREGCMRMKLIIYILRLMKSRKGWAGHVAPKRAMRNTGHKPEVKKQQGRPMHRWKDNIKMNLK
jgi:hypothetical protein